jgi:hypothetical protein
METIGGCGGAELAAAVAGVAALAGAVGVGSSSGEVVGVEAAAGAVLTERVEEWPPQPATTGRTRTAIRSAKGVHPELIRLTPY